MVNDLVTSLDKFHKTRLGYLVFGLVELGLAYFVLNKAMDTGNLILWALVLILLIGFLQNMWKLALSISKWRKTMD